MFGKVSFVLQEFTMPVDLSANGVSWLTSLGNVSLLTILAGLTIQVFSSLLIFVYCFFAQRFCCAL